MLKCLYTIFLLSIITSSSAFSQSINLEDLPDVEDFTLLRTNEEADTIVLVLHGGPSNELNPGGFQEFELVPTFSVVEIQKSEMLSQILVQDDLSYEECILANDTTAALIQKAVLHYKALDKFVVLAGFSWGAIIMGEYLDDYGNEDVDKIIPMAGRLNAPLEFVEYLKQGFLPYFLYGEELTVDLNQPYPLPNLILLGAAAFENRWIDSLQQLDLSNLLYTHAEFDVSTGRLLPDEVEFLEANNAQVLFLEGGVHGTVLGSSPHQEIFNFIRDINPIVSIEEVTKTNLSLFPTITDNNINLSTNSKGEITIFNFSGMLVENRLIESGQSAISVGHYNAGHYLVLFRSEVGHICTSRFAIH